jgi:small-conductance mechanosensitive channel
MTLLFAQDASPTISELDVNPVDAVTRGVDSALRGFLEQLPQVILGVVLVVVFFFLARLVANIVKRTLDKTTDRSESFSAVISRLVRGIVVFVGLLVGLIVAVPSVNLAAVIGSLGIGSVALGFAFSDILQNSLAGLLLLFRQPFHIGDQIEVKEYTGTVEAITIRETRLKTFGGQLILIPNSDVYSSSIRVQTANEKIRSVMSVGVDYDSDLGQARQVCAAATASVQGVENDPPPQVYFTEQGTSTVNLDIRYWTSSAQANVREVQDGVVEAVTNALNEAGIGLPADIIELDARVSFAEAVRLVRGGEGFGGAQNGQTQQKRLAAADASDEEMGVGKGAPGSSSQAAASFPQPPPGA